MKKKKFIFLPFIVVLLALGIAANLLYSTYYDVLVGAMGDSSGASSQEYKDEALAESKEIGIQLEEEGAVLLKNDNALPITVNGTQNVNVYGAVSGSIFVGSKGSASSGSVFVGLKEALESVGFTVNDKLWNLVEANAPAVNDEEVGSDLSRGYEIELSKYEQACSFTEAKTFSNYAIYTIGALGGEGSDVDRAADGSSNALQLEENERAILEKLNSEGFTVITLINSSTVMELGPVIEYSDAILWIGGTGTYGAYGVANILAGKANPSGRLSDTWMYDQTTSSTYYTALITTETLYSTGTGYSNYNEGIYLGYKWYETADAEGYWDGYANGYDDVVAYPFGYGLSYSSFTEELQSVNYENGTFTFEVAVENKGAYDGKDVVEIYVEKPYENGQRVEVSKVELVAFAKTQTLAKESGAQTLTLTVQEEDLASYDVTADDGNGAYVLAGGEYTFYVSSGETGAHCWKTRVGDKYSYTVNISEIVYSGDNKRSSDGIAATNLFETTDNDSGISSTDETAGFVQLSRADHFANAEQSIGQARNTNGQVTVESGSALYEALKKNLGGSSYETGAYTEHLADTNEFGTDTRTNQPMQYVFADLYTTDSEGNPLYTIDEETGEKIILKEVDYDDPRWAELISQMSAAEMAEMMGKAQYGTIAVESIGKIRFEDYDGPLGLTNYLKTVAGSVIGAEQSSTAFASEPIMAATRNEELIEKLGEAVGKEANAFNQIGWYAPGLNMHRTPFEGRTAEYFSEDSLLSGYMGVNIVIGAMSKGVICYGKHFALYDTDTNRYKAINVNISEQAAREIYFRPFEIAIKKGGMSGIMMSFSCINTQWIGGNYNAVHEMIRGEWGFKGSITTDTSNATMMSALKSLSAGTDMLLSSVYPPTAAAYAYLRLDSMKDSSGNYSDEAILALKTATKHTLYSYAQASLHRELDTVESDLTKLNAIYATINVVAYGGAVILLGLFGWFLYKDLKGRRYVKVVSVEENSEKTDES